MTLAAAQDWLQHSSRRLGGLVLFAMIALSTILCSFMPGRLHVTSGDVPQYLDSAYHLLRHHSLTSEPTPGDAAPAIGREPGYPLFLALLMAVDPAFGRFTPDCLRTESVCDARIYRIVGWANVALEMLTGSALYLLCLRLTGNVWAALLAAAYALFNFQMNKGWADPNSDRLAVWLVSLVMLTIAWAWHGGAWRWACVGLALAALTLVKFVFLLFAVLLASGAVAAVLLRRHGRRQILVALTAASILYGAVLGGWLVRNWEASGMIRLTDFRSGQALSTREALDHMTPTQFAAAFVYWTRGFGETLARRLFPPDVVAPFDLYQPGGFYDRGQNAYLDRLQQVMAELSIDDPLPAAAIVDREVRRAILDHPLRYAVTTLPILYRGIWIDEFVILGLPVFFWMLTRAIRRRQLLQAMLLAEGAFNLVIYALLSLNIPRYQMTAMPAIALAAGLALALAIEHRSKPQGGVERVAF